ncbi:hypothetical protein F4774DRAFT_404961 [Daldinia eschscholtzii]|nr:hypothetical protein F4774DRAFT_404961 [Daldinia eschscholtzii]
MNTPMLGGRELKVPILSRSRSTSSMSQAVDSSPRNEPKAKKQGLPLSYIPSHLLSGQLTQHGQFSRLRSQSSPSAPLRHSPSYQSEQLGADGSEGAGTRPLTMHHGVLPGTKQHLAIDTQVPNQTGPVASQDRSLPESPGFPKMLAAMNFPVPPTTSRPSTADACIGPTARYQSSITTPPLVRPRSSSKRATSSKGLPAASLDELAARQTSPPHRRSDPGESSQVPSKPERLVINTAMTRNSRSATVGETGSSLTIGSLRPRASSAASSTRVFYDPRTLTRNDNGRQSFPSPSKFASSSVRELVSMDEPYNVPIGIAISSPRDMASDMNKSFSGPEGEDLQDDTHTVPTISLTLPSPYEEKDHTRRDLESKLVRQCPENETILAKSTQTSTNHVALDFDPTIIPPIPNADDSRDSPILGRFIGISPTRRVRSRSPSRTREEQHIPTKSGMAQTALNGSINKASSALTKTVSENIWKFSQVMTTEITPEKQTDKFITTGTPNAFTITPIIVVANLTPQPESIVPASSSSTNHAPLRPRLSKLKMMSQPRGKPVPVKVHNSIITSHTEHTKLVADKFNRHTLTGVPTPPTSPSNASPKRNSHPIEITQRSQSRETRKLILQTKPRVHIEPDQEKMNEDAWRATSTKERLEKAKMARDEEISRLVERMLGVAKSKGETKERKLQDTEEQTEEQIEKRLQRLEEDGDACLRDVKLALQNMSKTLEELRKENGTKKLIMNEFKM